MHSEELPTNLDKEGVSNNSNNDFEKNNMIKNCEINYFWPVGKLQPVGSKFGILVFVPRLILAIVKKIFLEIYNYNYCIYWRYLPL